MDPAETQPADPLEPPTPEGPRPELQQAQELYRRAVLADPLFAPHAASQFESAGVLGEGGMGRVLKVIDRRFGRPAALKLLKTQKERHRRRFLRESLITARLAHPAIPPVYEAGRTADGELYMLMKLIEGQTLRQRIDAAHKRGRASVPRDLIEALIKACEAVAYAHSQGIIHRDLKPENIMIGAFGEVLVVDWGLARDLKAGASEDDCLREEAGLLRQGEERLTRAGAVIGTLGYMSPEQAGGVEAIDERSDIFALGVILCELLTGRSPIPGGSAMAMRVATVDGRFSRPRELASSLPPELEAIILAAMAAEASERLQRVEDLVAELRSFLAGEELGLYRYSVFERGARLVRRRPMAFLGALALCLLAAVIAALLGERRSLQRQQRLALSQRSLALAEARLKDIELSRARRSEKAALGAAEASRRQLDLFNAARELLRRSAPKGAVRSKVEAALNLAAGAPEAAFEAADIYARLGDGVRAGELLGGLADDPRLGTRALFRLHLLEYGDSNLWSPYLARIAREAAERGQDNEFSLLLKAQKASEAGDLDAALTLYQQVEARTKNFPQLYYSRGTAYLERGRFEDALRDLDRAVALDPGSSAAHSNQGAALAGLGIDARACESHQRALAIDPENLNAFNGLGGALKKLRRFDEALRVFDDGLKIEPRSAVTHLNRALLLFVMGRYQEALAGSDRALALDPELAKAHATRADALNCLGRFAEALKPYDRALQLDPELIRARLNRAGALFQLERINESLAAYAEAIERFPRSPQARCDRARVLRNLKRNHDALADAEAALAIDPDYADAYAARARARYALGQEEGALDDLRMFYDKAPDNSDEGAKLKPLVEHLEAKLAKKP